jgi:hypothetical protein
MPRSGDLHTVALVGTDGTIDWYCCRRFVREEDERYPAFLEKR